MKKFITLLLALAGMVSTASAKTIYFIDNWGRNNLQLYAWTGDSNNGGVSLSTAHSYIGKSDGWHWCYELNLGDYENFLIKHDWADYREQTPNLSSSNFEDGEYYEYYYESSDGSERLQKATLYTYTFNVTTAASWSDFYIYLWNSSNASNISGNDWPGIQLTGSSNVYTYTFKSYINTVGVIFNQGNNQPQTCDLTASEGDNTYYIASIGSLSTKGEAVKTNAYGYATYVSTNALSTPSGIAYYAEESSTPDGSAIAHTETNPASGTAMLIKGNANTTYHFATTETGNDRTSTNAFKAGNNSTIYGTADGKFNYVLNGDAFYLAKSTGMTVSSPKAYLQLSAQASGARVLRFADDETQGINAVSTVKATDGGYYNLSGQRVNAPTKGLYIKNGKKMVVK